MSLNALLHYWDIVEFRARTAMASEAAKTYLNFLWWIIDPMLTMAVFYLLFAVVLQRGTEDFVFFLMIGLVVWQWFGNTVGSAALSIQQSASLISQVSFPKVLLPLTVILTNTYKFLFVVAILLAVLWLAGFPPSPSYLALLPLMLLQLLLIYGASTAVAALVPLVPDLQYVVSNLLRAMMFLSGIFYPLSAVPPSLQPAFLMNPMLSIIDAYREVLMHQSWPDLANLRYAIGATLLLVVLATILTRSLDKRFARLVVQR